jgi:hypothetical protein
MVMDPSDPSDFGVVDLAGPDGVNCAGASQIVDVGGGRIAVACDGNEAVAWVDVSTIATGSPSTAAANANTLGVCPVPGLSEKRVRYLAPDGDGGVVVAAGPGFNPIENGELYRMSLDGTTCSLRSVREIAPMGALLGQIVVLTTFENPVWLVASGGGMFGDAYRGIFVVYDPGSGGQLQLCPDPVANLDAHWDTPAGTRLDPFALALTSDEQHLAIGAQPPQAPAAGVGYGKVLWATLSGDDPCALEVSAEDLTAGDIAATVGEPSTYRRGPQVIEFRAVAGC